MRESLAEVNTALCAAIGPLAVGLMGDEIGLQRNPGPKLGLVGDPHPCRPALVVSALREGRIPVVAPLAKGPLNVNADEAAVALAVGLGAERILFVTDVPGVLLDGDVLASIGADEAESLCSTTARSRRDRAEAPGRGHRGPPRHAGGDRRDGGACREPSVSAVADLRTHVLPTYARADVTFVAGEGCWLVDDDRAGATSTSSPASRSSGSATAIRR